MAALAKNAREVTLHTAAHPDCTGTCTALANGTATVPFNVSDACGSCSENGGRLVCPSDLDHTTMASEFSLYCDRAVLRGIPSTLFFAGYSVGSMTGGMLADKFGRRPASLGSLALLSICFGLSAVAPSYDWYLVSKFFIGAACAGTATSGFTLATELVGPSLRTRATTELCGYAWAFLCCALALTCYLVRKTSWRIQIIVVAAPNFLLLGVWWWLLPESPFWLMRQGRHERTKQVISKLLGPGQLQRLMTAGANPSEAPLGHTEPAEDATPANVGLMELVRPCRMLKMTLVEVYLWCTVSLSYYAISFSEWPA